MKKILAVSGGVDSMVLLDIFKDDPDILVAHFNHGTRKSADTDEEFVKNRCKELNVDFTSGRVELGGDVSEEVARKARYDFLYNLRADIISKTGENVEIFTAHHLDDLVESIFINVIRGTSWRGLTPFSAPHIIRPFLNDDVLMPESKADILTYAARNKITFREDPTNSSDKYLRNRIRLVLKTLEPEKRYMINQKIKTLYFLQQSKRAEIENILGSLMPEDEIFQRSWFIELSDEIAIEILRFMLEKKNIKLTGPQLTDFLLAVRTYSPEKKFNLPGDRLITIHKNYFSTRSL